MGWPAIAALVVAIIGAAVGGYSAYQQGQAQKQAANYQALVAQNQAEWAEYNAQAERDAYTQQAQIYELNALKVEEETRQKEEQAQDYKEKLLSTQAARYAKAGVAMEGTPLDVMAQTALEADKSIESILYEGGVEAWNWRAKESAATRSASISEIRGASTSGVFQSEAALNTLKGQNAESQGIFAAGSTILTGASNAISKYKVPTYNPSLLTSNVYDSSGMLRYGES